MKKIFLAVIASFAMSFAFAQSNSPKLSIGADIGIPTGQANSLYSVVPGASLKFEAPVASSLSLTVTTGFSSFIPKGIYSDYLSTATYIPIEGGFKAFVNPSFYLGGDLGASFNVNSGYTGNKAAFIYAPGLGVVIPTDSKNAVDLAFRYEGRVETGGTLSQVALRIAYKFGL